MAEGTCALTGARGKFVKAHIIPAALTPPEVKGAALRQAGYGQPAVKRWSSWYDPRLVTAEGETFLRDLDTWAIEELRKHKLVWSSWRDEGALVAPDHRIILPEEGMGAREVNLGDPKRLRLFFLSVLWRAAASTMPDLDEIQLSDADLDYLRNAILSGDGNPLSFYPIQLLQLSTRGRTHNNTPFRKTVTEPDPINGGETPPYEVIRFYFDGLVTTFDTRTFTPEEIDARGRVLVGYGPKLYLGTVTFEKSFQRENLKRVMAEDLHREIMMEGNRAERRRAKAHARKSLR